jgi:hypothetical protein
VVHQHNGIHVKIASVSQISIASFLENTTQAGMQISLVPTYQVAIAQDNTQINNFLFVGGEDGFYIEGGTGANYNNIAHGFIFAYYPDASFGGTRDRERTWLSQGGVYDLRGTIRTDDHNYRFVETVSDRRNHTGKINAMLPRGSLSVLNRNASDNRQMYFGPRDHWMAVPYYVYSDHWHIHTATLGLFQSNFDDLYRVSFFCALQGQGETYSLARTSGGAETVGGTTDNQSTIFDLRNGLRQIPKFGCCSSYLLPWNNITDKRTGIIFRVAQVPDTGRNSNIAVVWPDNSNVVTIVATP